MHTGKREIVTLTDEMTKQGCESSVIITLFKVKYIQKHFNSNFCFRTVKETALSLHSYVRMQ
jgi:UTP-glucose-1-phosphate uridylyltransferase